MLCVLMNKNTPILLANLTLDNTFDEIKEVYNLEYSPLSLAEAFNTKGKVPLKALNKWFKERGIPSWRKNLEVLLANLQIEAPEELLNKAFALSLTDQYWLKPYKENIKWEDINFFTNDFEDRAYLKASLASSCSSFEVDLYSPNNTTDGMIQKAWIIENKERILIKGSYTSFKQEPINEWLATRICQELRIKCCNYSIFVIDNKLVSKCPCFIKDYEELISAYDVLNLEHKRNDISYYEHYIKILENKGIKEARKNLSDMFLIDYLMFNIDRHLRNFGIIRNVETLKWERVAPIFDTGQSLGCDLLTKDLNLIDGNYKFFNNTTTKFSDLIKYIDIDKYDLKKLIKLPLELKEQLEKYQKYTDMSEERIEKIINGFTYRINKLIELRDSSC